MRWFSQRLPLVAGLLLALPSFAQAGVQLTTLDVRDTAVALASGPYRIAGAPAPTEALVSGAVLVWATAEPVVGSSVRLGDVPEVARAAAVTADRPTEVALRPVAPNPLAGRARIPYELPDPAVVRLVVYDALGREVAVLVDGEVPAGRHQATLDVSRLSPGVYHVRLSVGAVVGAARFTVVR